jgi:hypothetical protein
MLKKPELFKSGHHQSSFHLPSEIKGIIANENWDELDAQFQRLTRKEGELYTFLHQYHTFESIEFIISIRDAKNHWEEDGIWHDDGTRVFAFSLSLTDEEVQGGKLGIRRKGEESMELIPTPEFGSVILFLTGTHGFEHKIHQVTKGRRLIIAGWCS